MNITLPISKSIANRLLVLQAMHGDELMPVSCAMGEDITLMHRALCIVRHLTARSESAPPMAQETVIDIQNAGTCMRFLTAYFAQLEGCHVLLTGCTRMKERPIGQLVDALRSMGAQIEYTRQDGFPPLMIHGKKLNKKKPVSIPNPESTQFVSALLLIGALVITHDSSPYIMMTKHMCTNYPNIDIETDWSAAAFWYEYVALHGGELDMNGLKQNSMQGDKKATEIFAQLGVQTYYIPSGVHIRHSHPRVLPKEIHVDFCNCPDLYPAVFYTCERLGVTLHATGTERLIWKESNRLEAASRHEVREDHRMAMALLAADYPVDDTSCIAKSYPQFEEQLCTLRKHWTSSFLAEE